jgi:PAS domain S-box-containing protein
MLSPRFQLFIIAILSSITGGVMRAQEQTSITQVTQRETGKPDSPVKLNGVVIDASPVDHVLTLHDGTHSVGVHLQGSMVCPKVGETVEVTGETFTHVIAGHSHPRVRAQEIQVRAPGLLPPPKPISIKELNRFENFDQWVSVEGHVLRWKFRSHTNELMIVLVGADSWTTAVVRVEGRPAMVTQLMGAKLRLTGINASETSHDAFGAMTVPSVAQIEILQPGHADPFEAPLVSLQEVATLRTVPGSRVKVSGTVLARFGERMIYLRGMASNEGAQCNLLATAWPRVASDEEYADAGALPQLQPGDVVEMVGTPMADTVEPELRKFALCYCHVRVLGHQPPPKPIPSTLREISAGKWTHDLVQVQGRLTLLQSLPVGGGEWRTVMVLEDGGVSVPLSYQVPGHTAFANLKVDDELQANVLVERITPQEPIQLRLPSLSDVQSLGVSAHALSRQFWIWTGSVLTLFVLLLGWIALLRRTSRKHAKTAAELKAITEAARESELRWKLLFEQSPLSVQIFAPDGQTKRVNAAWMKLFRLTEEQGLAFNVLHDPDLNASGAVNLIRQAFEGHSIQVPPVPYPVSQDPPEYRWIGGVLYPLKNEAGQIIEVVTVHNDITETKQAEDAMLALNQTLEQRVNQRTSELKKTQAELTLALEKERELGELKSRFVTMVSHEFRTPLGIIMSAIELIRHYDDRLPADKRTELQQDIFSSTRHMAGLMEQMLVLGRVEAGAVSCKLATCDLETLAGKLTDECLSATNRKCAITATTEGALSSAQADEALLRHIFSNLIHNAVKYSPDGGAVQFTIRREGTLAVFQVIDQGIGIPPEDQKNLFEAFQRGSNVGDIPGTGLGLVIIKRCVDLHGGTLHIDSVVGQGTTFTVSLPLFVN